jgi:hypothetical protein
MDAPKSLLRAALTQDRANTHSETWILRREPEGNRRARR